MSQSKRKKKLEMGLQDLFSDPGQPTELPESTQPDETRQSELPASNSGEEVLEASPVPSEAPDNTAPSPLPAHKDEENVSAEPASPSETERLDSDPREAVLEDEEHVVVFTLAGEHYAVDIAAVESIIKIQDITPVPHAPEFVEGVTNLRGTILPVLDLRTRFELPRSEATRETRIVVVEVDRIKVGVVVDSVTEVLQIPTRLIEHPQQLAVAVGASFMKGIARVGEQLVILLDLDKVFADHERAELPGLPMMS